MGYENYPAVELLATQCALCGRPLLDAESVECGMGPTCRARHGASSGPGAADWSQIRELVQGLPGEFWVRATDLIGAGDQRALANWAVSRVAIGADRYADQLVLLVAAAGFVELAARLADRHSRQVVHVEREGDRLLVKSPYNEGFVEQTRSWQGRRWDRYARRLGFPVSSRAALWGAICENFGSGTMVVGEHGMKRI